MVSPPPVVLLPIVEEAFTLRLERVVSPPVAVRVVPMVTVPVKFAVEEIVWPLIKPEVMVPAVREPIVPLFEKRFVVDALVEKKLVVVAEVPVALTKVKFWRVVEEVRSKLVEVAVPAMVSPVPVVPAPIVVEAEKICPAVHVLA
jgi:hypothetical protein